ncbi:MAG: LysR substrate-binding domain-containing protein [Oscillospiraceae bacterium]
MNDKQLNSLIKIVECGSFASAEESLFMSRQAIKKQIDSLEEELGFTLLFRTHQGIALTPAGEEFCQGIREILGETEALIQRCKERAHYEQFIRIATPYHPRLWLENVFAEFHRRFPNIKQQVIMQPSSRSIDGILEGRLDIAEYVYRPELETSGVQYLKLFPLTYHCLVAPSHPLSDRESVTIDDLIGNTVCINKGDIDLVSYLNKNSRNLTFDVIGNDIQKIKNTCYNGGIFISKAYFLGSMQPLIPIRLEIDLVPMAVVLYSQTPSPNVRKFLNIIKEMYPNNGAAK